MQLHGGLREQPTPQRVKWKAFPARPEIGCLPAEGVVNWSWEAGGRPATLEIGWREWVKHAET
eukprot:6306728-Karenia_brevis.AAC.1